MTGRPCSSRWNEPIAAEPDGPVVVDPIVEQRLEFGVERAVAVVVELPNGDAEPVRGSDLDHSIDGEAE